MDGATTMRCVRANAIARMRCGFRGATPSGGAKPPPSWWWARDLWAGRARRARATPRPPPSLVYPDRKKRDPHAIVPGPTPTRCDRVADRPWVRSTRFRGFPSLGDPRRTRPLVKRAVPRNRREANGGAWGSSPRVPWRAKPARPRARIASREHSPSPSLSKSKKASLNSAICSSESWVADSAIALSSVVRVC